MCECKCRVFVPAEVLIKTTCVPNKFQKIQKHVAAVLPLRAFLCIECACTTKVYFYILSSRNFHFLPMHMVCRWNPSCQYFEDLMGSVQVTSLLCQMSHLLRIKEAAWVTNWKLQWFYHKNVWLTGLIFNILRISQLCSDLPKAWGVNNKISLAIVFLSFPKVPNQLTRIYTSSLNAVYQVCLLLFS